MAHYNNPQHPGDPVDGPSSACKLSAEVHEAVVNLLQLLL